MRNFPHFFIDVQTTKNTKKDKNAKKEDRVINGEDATAVFKYYSYASIGKDLSDIDAVWNEINGKDESDIEIDKKEISESKIKPVIEVSKKVFDESDDIAGKTVKVEFKIDGENVDDNYCTTGFHVYWDERLKAVNTNRNAIAQFEDTAGGWLTANLSSNGEHGVFLTMSGRDNGGSTGTLWSITFALPDDAKPGDVFPIDVAFEDGDLFKSIAPNTAELRVMQAYLETYGINSEKNPSTDSYLVKANAEYADRYIAIADKSKLSGDVNNDGAVNLKDVVLIRRYIAGGWNVELDEKTADVNKDGAVNLKDVVILRRYIAGGWGVTL